MISFHQFEWSRCMRALKSLFCMIAMAWSIQALAVQDVGPDQRVWFVEPSDGAVVSSPFVVRFGVAGMTVMPSGDVVKDAGHHHLVINGGPIDANKLIPYDATHMHFGFGQTETTLNLPPGTYTLTSQFANGNHKSFGPAMSKTITVIVR
jgi:hypothetical protein